MALIQTGSFDDLTASLELPIDRPVAKGRTRSITSGSFSDLAEVREDLKMGDVTFDTSPTPRGLTLSSIRLDKNFDSFLQKKNEIYFLAWAWDLSGEPVYEYPGKGAEPGQYVIPIVAGNVREFIGSGILLFPSRVVTAGMGVRIMIWESDQKARALGETLTKVSAEVKKSKLNNLLSAISLAGPQLATLTLVKDAAIELAHVIGIILKANGDDYVDFYEGYFPVSERWTTGKKTYSGVGSSITLNRIR